MHVFAITLVQLPENGRIILGWAEISCCTVYTVMESKERPLPTKTKTKRPLTRRKAPYRP